MFLCFISDWLIDVDRNGDILRNMLLFCHYWWPACTSGHAIWRDAVDNSLVLNGPLSHFVFGNYSLSKNILCTKLMNNYLERLKRSSFWKDVCSTVNWKDGWKCLNYMYFFQYVTQELNIESNLCNSTVYFCKKLKFIN